MVTPGGDGASDSPSADSTSLDADASGDVGDAAGDVAAEAAIDASDAATRAPDGGCLPTDYPCLCDAYIAANEVGNTPASTCSASEVVAFRKDLTGGCLHCLLSGQAQCLDDPAAGITGQDCEDPFTGVGAGETAAECLATLACDLGVNPAASPAPASANGPISGLCNDVPEPTCVGGSPGGACKTAIAAGFPSSFSVSQIGGSIAVVAYASGRAGAIVNCAFNNCSQCLQ